MIRLGPVWTGLDQADHAEIYCQGQGRLAKIKVDPLKYVVRTRPEHPKLLLNVLITIRPHFFCHMTTGSAFRSFTSIVTPFVNTSGCLLTISQPMCEKKKPRFELYGSAFVSMYLWCNRWSRAHLKMLC